MDKTRAFYSSVVLLSVIQIQHVLATGCNIVSVTSSSASTLNVVWSSYSGATKYLLDLRVVNSTSIAPVVVMQSAPSTQRLVQGLRPGHNYQVTLKVFQFYDNVCTAVTTAITVPATSQITFSKAISSTSIRFEWSSVIGADNYILYVDKLFSNPITRYSETFTSLGGQMDGLSPSTTYNCYIYSSNSAGRGAKSNVKTITTLVQPPTGVSLVPTGKSTARVTWNSVSKVLLYQVTVSDSDTSNAPVIRNTSGTTMDISNLEPCSNYTVGVSSVNAFLVPGEASAVTHLTSTINPVTTISVDYTCSGGMVTVTWDLVFGANMYRATAVDGTGASLNCTSASTSCQITLLKCGEKYTVHVTAISDDCESTSDISKLFETVPCAPANPQTTHDCSSNVIVFTWEPTNNTFYYVAKAVDNTGQTSECRTADNMCFFTNTGCGQFYTYTVYAVSSGCNSEASHPEFVRTSPCLPTNVKTAAECHSDMLITTWDSAAGALSYTVEAQGNTGETYNCTSSSNSCAVTGVPCGEHLSVWIVASNDNCSTDRVLGEVAETVPCVPTNVSASADCSQDSARVNWTTSIGSVFYIAIAEDASGNSHSCFSMGTNCVMDGLSCGQNYTASVIGTNLKCNSSHSHEVSFKTAPCPPTNIEAFRDCNANHAVIVWQNHQHTGVYTATIEDQSGAQLSCNSNTVNNCKITSLPCGRRYNVTVSYSDGDCASTSTAIRMDSVPCGPEDVQASVTCVTGELTVTWNISVPADNYTSIISGGPGAQPLHCNSTERRCVMEGLTCGSYYTVVVFSVTGDCFSLPSSEVTVQTLPCPPTNVAAVHTCAPLPVPVSWTASTSANHYIAVAWSGGGHRSECTSNGTSCDLPGLRCGEVYTIGVSGADDNCTGGLSDTVPLSTEPCPPTGLSSQLMCSAGTAEVSWVSSPNAVTYSLRATSGADTLTCSGPNPNCTLSNLLCDRPYDIEVNASDGTCVSNYSAPYRQDEVPCAPVDVTTEQLCGTSDVRVNWTASALPFNYSVSATLLDGNSSSVSCHTELSTCSLRGLRCGQAYNVSVKASSGSCCGPYSVPQTVHTAPCPPQGLTAVTDCGTDSLLASWHSSPGAVSYTTSVTGPGGFSASCSASSGLTCSVSGLQCASHYTVSVSSEDGHCSSSPAHTSLTTGPCDPVNVTAVLQCGSDAATVSWDAAAGAVAYTVLAEENGAQHATSCRSGATSCQLNQLQCGKVYNLTVMAEDATCNSTGGTSTTLMTAPCSPSIQSSGLICGTASSSVTWMPMADATGYLVNATAANGHAVSCSSAAATCTLTDLQCGETYTTTITAQGRECDSPPSSPTLIPAAPCPPAVLSKNYTCGTSTAVFHWTRPVGNLSFLAQVAGAGYEDSCQTTNTSCAFRGLPCGLALNVTVLAQGAECNSSLGVSESLETVPCAPEDVNATLLCSSRSAQVSWVGSLSAVGYSVTLTAQDGHTHHCQSNSTSCQVPDIHCGETYDITVTPYSETCPGHQSAVHHFRAGLCAPSNVTVSSACEDSVVSWSAVAGAEMFVATATADDGHTHTCSSNHSNSCNFTDLHCGESYAVTVVTLDRGCPSEPSSAEQLRTALCPPGNLTGQVSCDTNALTLSWDHSSESQVTYALHMERMGGGGVSVVSTPNSSHTLSDLLCGQRYGFRIAAQDGPCRSRYSPAMEISTAPCQPTNFTARVDCGTNRGNFSWVETPGAGFYTVEVTGDHGHVASCSSNDTSCAVKLHCGRSYTATLVASTESCNSTRHADIHFESAPCLPEDVSAELQCNTNVMDVTWAQTPGEDDYTAWAISEDGHRASCNSTSNSCSIHSLRCGQVYEVAVTSSSLHCEIIAGSDYKVQSAPCKPENTSVEQNCSSSAMTVRWSHGGTAQNYSVQAVSASGRNDTCDSTQSSCSFLDLSCGQLYTFTVMGHTNVCMSEMSDPVEKHTAPCPPTAVSAQLNCSTHTAEVSWSSTAGASTYSVLATSAGGHNSSCSEPGSACVLADLLCGQDYSVMVEAMHSGCPGPATAPVTLTTGPCVPMNISVQYNVSSAQVMWGPARGASSYSVQAVTDQAAQVGCSTSSTSCLLNGLRCGHIYNVTVTAGNPACDGVTSNTHRLMTEPCPPTSVQASVVCEQLTATVSWQQSHLAVGYVAYLDNQDGHDTSCVATEADSSCEVPGLLCGTVYRVWVKALGQQHNSSDSTVVSLTSGSCQTSSIEAVMDCDSGSALVSWQPSVGATSYLAQLTASSGHAAACSTNHTHCELSSLRCGEEYNVTVEAVGDTCNSTARMAGHLATEPCVPLSLSVLYSVSSARARWAEASGASSYSVRAVTDQGSTVGCNATTTSCFLHALQCSQTYNVTVTAHNQACNNTATSEPHSLMTEPCPPTSVQASVVCEQLTATVSWQQSHLAVGYVAYLDNQDGHDTSCVATEAESSCEVSGLLCGTVYRVWVKALGQQHNSSDSTVVSLTSAPCLPREVQVDVDCSSDGGAVVSWNSTYGAANFSLTAIVSGGLQTLCETQQHRCNVTGLSCGETYNLSLTASNQQCSLAAPMHANLTTRPCPPQRVAVDLPCGALSAAVSWEERSDVELYKASAVKASGGPVLRCNSTGSSCQLPGLDCGETYNLTVMAYSQGCCSHASSSVSVQTGPCQPVILSAQALCHSDDVQITWHPTNGVVNYLLTATGSLGYEDALNTTQTSLWATLPCGQDYNVTVRGRGSECDGVPSSPAFFSTGPCVPRHLSTYVQCEASVGSVSWGPSDGAQAYVAVATGRDGHTHRCLTNSTSCTWDDLHCGEQYSVAVSAKANNCTSLPSNTTVIHMDPCVPQNLSATVSCDMRVVSLSWDAGNGTDLYVVMAEAWNQSVSLSTSATTAHFSEFTCGQTYSLTVTPHHQHCPGTSSAPASVQTWPCPPADISTRQDCLSGIVMLTWQAGNGSDYFMADMQSDSGLSAMCMSETNQCSVPGLTCGHNFSVSVTASNQQCNTTSMHSTSLESVPCVPTDVSVVTDCGNNTARVSWLASLGAVRYSVTARSNHGNASCLTSDLTCSLDSLTCGDSYTVQVVAEGNGCSSFPSQGVTFDSAPCPPHNVSVEVSCSSNDMTVSWDAMRGADHFLVSVIGDGAGSSEPCNTTSTACSLSGVACGNTFTVQVTSVRGACRSQDGHSYSVQSAPCQPQAVRGSLDCVTNSAWISWDAAPGAGSYAVSAVGGEEHVANCTTSSNTTCEVEDLACGVLYNFSVVATNSRCDSPPSSGIALQTAPCSLAGITAVAQCHNSSILVMWELMEGGDGDTVYTVTAEAADHTFLRCNNTGTSCYLHGARCDLHYTVIVAASSDECSDLRSPPYRISMEPCPPTNVVAEPSCEDHSALVSWSPSPVAETYHVVAVGVDGHEHTCNSSSSNCSVTGLHCNQQFTICVTASHQNCSSQPSYNVTINTGPCQPDSLAVTYHCTNQSAQLSWTPQDNAVAYYGCAQAGGGDMLYCHSTSPTCTIQGLDCGTAYNFSVQASDGTCNSSFSDPVLSGAAPCPPDTVEVQLMPMQAEVQMLHFGWTASDCPHTQYLLRLSGSLLGDSQAQFELSSYWTNLTYFEMPLPCGSAYSATVESRNAAGTSDPSAPLSSTTAPCPPSGVVYSGNSSWVTVSWNASVFATRYTVYDSGVWPRAQLCSTAGLSCSLANMSVTELVVTASNTAGESQAAPVSMNVTTHDRRRRDLSEQVPEKGVLSAPVLDITHAVASLIFAEWSEVDGASEYSLLIRRQGSTDAAQELTVLGESVVVTDLNPDSTYCLSVRARASDSTGPESQPVCVQTGQ